MQAKDLTERFAFDKRTPAAHDGHGNDEDGFAEQFVRWAATRNRLGGEQVIAGRREGRNLVNITVRYDPETFTIAEHWRARDLADGTVYDIKSVVDPDAHTARRRQFLEVLAETGRSIVP